MKIDLGFSPRDAVATLADELVWIPHDGGYNPVREGEALAGVRFRSGFEANAKKGADKNVRWSFFGDDNDITHYAVTPPRVAAPVTEPAPMSADEVLIRAREAVISLDGNEEYAIRARNADFDEYGTIQAILAFHRDLSKPLAEVAPHAIEDADERVAYETYVTVMKVCPLPWEKRHSGVIYCGILAGIKRGRELERGE